MSNFIQVVSEAAKEDGFFGNHMGGMAVEREIADALRRTGRETVIVSRHAGAVEWLRRQGIAGTVIEQATAADVAGKVVIGNLPLHLAAEAHQVGSIDLPGLTREQRGRDLTPEEMDAAGATIRWYVVAAVDAAEKIAVRLESEIPAIEEALTEAALESYVHIGRAIGFRRGYAAALRGDPPPEADEDEDE